MGVHNLVEKVAAVVVRQLHVPNQPVHFSNPHRPEGIDAVVNPKALFKIYGVLADLILHQEHQLPVCQKFPEVQHLQIGAELRPAGIVQVNMVFPAYMLA